MAQQVLVRNEGRVGVSLANINYGLATSKVDAYISSVGGGSGGAKEKTFPGEPIVFKKGVYYIGFGDKKRTIKAGTELIFNGPNVMSVWIEWKDSNSGKRYPTYTAPRFPAAGDDPILREALGRTAEEFGLLDWKRGDPISAEAEAAGWEIDNYGNLSDPIKPGLVFPVRNEIQKEAAAVVNHFIMTSVTSCIAGYNLYREIMEEMKLHAGQLPRVELGVEKKTFKKTEKDKKGREKKVENTVDVPELEIVGWADAIDADNPAVGGVTVTADEGEAADIGTVTAKSRVNGKASANGKAKLLAAPVKGKAKSRRTVEAVEDDNL